MVATQNGTQSTSGTVTNNGTASVDYSTSARAVMHYAIAEPLSFAKECASIAKYLRYNTTWDEYRVDARYSARVTLQALSFAVSPEKHASASQATHIDSKGMAKRISNSRPLDSWCKQFIAEALSAHVATANVTTFTAKDMPKTAPDMAKFASMAHIPATDIYGRLTDTCDAISRVKTTGLSLMCLKTTVDGAYLIKMSLPGMTEYYGSFTVGTITAP